MVNGMDDDKDSLAHYGVKGMRWGVRKKDETSGRDSGAKADEKKSNWTADDVEKFFGSTGGAAAPTAKNGSWTKEDVENFFGSGFSTEQYKSVQLTPTKSANAELRDNTEKFISKTDPSGASTNDGHMTYLQKQRLTKIAVGTLAVGAVVGYSAYKMNQPDFRFNMSVTQSKLNSWTGSGYVKPASWDRKEFTLPAGHTFNRISRAAEDGFRGATYTTHNTEDFHRYVVGFRKELGPVSLQHITWQSTAPVRVPDLKTTLDGLKTAMERSGHTDLTPDDVLWRYNSMSGGGWKDDMAKSFFSVLKERGFGAIVDEMDAGVIGETPLVLFDTDNMGPKKATPLGASTIRDASKLVKDFPKPPRK